MARIWNHSTKLMTSKHKQPFDPAQGKANAPLKRKVFVGMSGGVDSSVAAALLKNGGFPAQGGPASGWDVTGVHIKMWGDPEIPCTSKEDRYDAMRAAAHLGIPFETWDLTSEYKQAVVEYMIAEYAAGRTPNPDVMCNREIKFGVFLRRALSEGAGFVATGHYVLLRKGASQNRFETPPRFRNSLGRLAPFAEAKDRGRSPSKSFEKHLSFAEDDKIIYKLVQAKDVNKDQSYFLWTLTQEQLRHCLFPIGEYTKPEVRAMAKKFGLPNADKPDSQGICFIGEIDMAEFLKKYIPVQPGPVATTSGKVVGEHDGLAFYTIGQRHGLGIGGSPSSRLRRSESGIPYYVAGKDPKTNTLVVAEGPYDEKLFSNKLEVADVNWISGVAPKLPLKCEARIRYRQPLQKAQIIKQITHNKKNKTANDKMIYTVHFDEPQRAVTSGQSIVFYALSVALAKEGGGYDLLGGGVIR